MGTRVDKLTFYC